MNDFKRAFPLFLVNQYEWKIIRKFDLYGLVNDLSFDKFFKLMMCFWFKSAKQRHFRQKNNT